MSRPPTYTSDDLQAAIASARSWRETLRNLGMKATSAASIRSVREHADRLGLDYEHFVSQRHWNDDRLQVAIDGADSWEFVTAELGMSGSAARSVARGHARRLGIDVSHLDRPKPVIAAAGPDMEPDLAHLRKAGPSWAAGWFLLCGYEVAWPLEPCRYDLLVHRDGQTYRVQVKTSTLRSGSTWAVRLTRTESGEAPYDPDEIDWFLILDGDLRCYLIPAEIVGGRFLIHLSAYQDFRVFDLPVGPLPRRPLSAEVP